jgi:TolA-binding protein
VSKHLPILLTGLLFSALLLSCSTKRDKWLNRNWHGMNTRYNGYYYGKMALDEGFAELAKANKDNYNSVIQVYRYADKAAAQSVNPLSDRVLTKGGNMVRKHSMLINGKQRNKWIDDCYFIMGKANFIKREYSTAIQQFYYVMQTSESEATKELARLWMIKTYQDMGEFGQAESEFNNVNAAKIPAKQRWEYHASLADFFIKSEDYTPAIIPLEELIKVTRKKTLLARYTFILGQIYRQMGEMGRARQMFAEAVKLKPEFELEFQAAIALAMASEGESDNQELRKRLRKLLRDDKNIDFQDQIYYALAILDEKEKNKENALANYKKSVRTSTINREQKGLSYLALAEIYFADRRFVPAQAYYDSASSNLDKKNPKFDRVNALKENLGEIVANINIVQEQDSLLALAQMSEKERLKKIEAYIDKLRKEDELKKTEEENPLNVVQNGGGPGAGVPGAGKWYFYNPQTVAFGVKDFTQIWGGRKNEDNWRRKNKASVAGDFGNQMLDPLAMEQQKRDELEATRYNPETYLALLPFSDSAQAASREMIYQALYDLGILYKQNLKAYDRSMEAFEDLVRRDTRNKHFPETYYQLYVLCDLLRKTNEAQQYKNIILERFPQSEYALIIKDPEYLKQKELQKKGAERFYEETFSLFKKGDFASAAANCVSAKSVYAKSEVLPRFALLYALIEGRKGKDVYLSALTSVETEYPGTEQALEAGKIIARLNESGNAENASDSKPTKNELFEKDNRGPHYVVIHVPGAGVVLNKSKTAIANFNSSYYSTETIDIQELMFGADAKVLVLKTFEGSEKALVYLYALEKNSEIIEQIPTDEICTPFVITVKNFAALLSKPNLPEYMKFYYENYRPK